MNPTLILKFIGGSIGLGGGITGSVFSSFQTFTKIKIEDLLKEKLFEYTDTNDLKDLQKKLDESKNTDDKSLQLTELKEIKKQTEDSPSYDENGKKLKEWCNKQKPKYIKKLLPSYIENLLLSYIKEFCIITIGEKITSSKQFTLSDSENETLETKTNELASHESSNDSQRGKIDDVQELKEVKTKTDGEKKRALLNWCQKTYKKTYKNSTDNLWKLADYYCKKTQ